MHRRFVYTLATAAVFAGATSPAVAQQAAPGVRLIELGVDAGVTFDLTDPKTTTINIPAQVFRVGFFINDRLSLEPALAINAVNGGGTTFTEYRGQLGLLWHFNPPSVGHGWYARPFAGFEGAHTKGNTTTQAVAGAGVGIKLPLASRLATRFEANYAHLFSQGSSGSNNAIGLLAGLSFFNR